MNAPVQRSSLIPDILRHPAALFVAWVAPQLVLLGLNGMAWDLASGEMTVRQRAEALRILAAEGAILALGAGVSVGWAALKRRVGLGVCAAGLAVHVGYLWLFLARGADAWPAAVTAWMLSPTTLIYYQFMLMMPAAFYCALRLACFDAPLRRCVDTSVSASAFLLVPALWFLFLHAPRLFGIQGWHSGMEESLILAAAVGSTIVLLSAFIRLASILYAWLAERGSTAWIVPSMAGLAGPLAGLILNRYIPFPCDFQSVGIYVLAVVNGVVLLLPPSVPVVGGTRLWVMRAILYPFSLYFFAVFLPFLPLSLPAMLVFGAGFLILSPTLLFVVHTQRLWRETATLRQRLGTWRTLAAGLLCLGAIPLFLAAQALFDRVAMNNALSVVFTPDCRDRTPALHRFATRRALGHMREMKEGNYLPFLTDFYNTVVFDGMVLPDEKVLTLHRALFGQPPPPPKPRRESLFLAPGISVRPVLPPTSSAVRLQSAEVRETLANGVTRSSIVLSMRNGGERDSEFVADIAIPRGVVVSAFRLDVNGTQREGRLVEMKAAVWVYSMIRGFTRRDPGLLIYTSPTTLRLRVYPFQVGETRTCAVELTFPQGIRPRVSVGDQVLLLGAASDSRIEQPLTVASPAGATHLILPPSALSALPTVRRRPCLHFIVDNSLAATNAAARLAEEVDRVASRPLPEALDRCRVTLANYERAPAAPDLIPLGRAADSVRAVQGRALPCRGGFRFDLAIAGALWEWAESGPRLAPDGAPVVPVFVICPAAADSAVASVDLTPFADLVPDAPAYYVAARGQLQRAEFGGLATDSGIEPPLPVVLLRNGPQWRAVVPGADLTARTFRGGALEVYDGGRFRPLAATTAPRMDRAYPAAMDLLETCRRTALNPGCVGPLRAAVVESSRELPALTPMTAFVVVENSAQEKMLSRKERQALDARAPLEFEATMTSASTFSTPEPGLLLMLPPALALLGWHRRRRAAKPPRASSAG